MYQIGRLPEQWIICVDGMGNHDCGSVEYELWITVFVSRLGGDNSIKASNAAEIWPR